MPNNERKDIKDILYDAVCGIEFGSVTIHIQDGKIVYIEKTEKIKVKG
ncbi:MAG: YezD family protein [Mogibacterium sp.]|nr:YezD family protein [Mogibacterium sp.]